MLLPVAPLLAVLCICFQGGHADGLQCLGDSQDLRDWWSLYKMIGNWQGESGYEVPNRNYSYSTDTRPGLERSSEQVETNGALGLTLQQLWNTGVDYVLYNDEPLPPFGAKNITCYPWDPNGMACAQKYGHSKGIVAWDQDGHGFWVVHSFPLFPCGPGAAGSLDPNSGLYNNFQKYCNLEQSVYSGPENSQVIHAQNAMCVSFSGWTEFAKISCLLGVNTPVVYDYKLSSLSKSKLPAMDAVSRMVYTEISSMCSSSVERTDNITQSFSRPQSPETPISQLVEDSIKSRGGQALLGFATGASFGKDIYADLIAPTVKGDVVAQTWWEIDPTNPNNTLMSQCSPPYKVYNVSHLNYGLVDGGPQTMYTQWNNHNNFMCTSCGPCYYTPGTECGTGDHSKWALVDGMYCGADKNRAPTQFTRGGGALCLNFGSNDHALLTTLNKATTPYSCP